MFWKEKIQPGLRETQCIQKIQAFLFDHFSLPTHLGSAPTAPHVGSEPFQPVPESFPAPSPFRLWHSSLRHWWSLWNASTNTDKDKLLENKHSPGAAVRVQEGRPGSGGGTRTPGWWQEQLLPPLPAASGLPCGKGSAPSWWWNSEDAVANLKFISEVIVPTFLLHFWSFSPFSGCILFSWLLSAFCPGGPRQVSLSEHENLFFSASFRVFISF